jgi:hypothetical protein
MEVTRILNRGAMNQMRTVAGWKCLFGQFSFSRALLPGIVV